MFDGIGTNLGNKKPTVIKSVEGDLEDLKNRILELRAKKDEKEYAEEKEVEAKPDFKNEVKRVFVEDLARKFLVDVGADRVIKMEFANDDLKKVAEGASRIFEKYRKDETLKDSFKKSHRGVGFDELFGKMSAEEFSVLVLEEAGFLDKND